MVTALRPQHGPSAPPRARPVSSRPFPRRRGAGRTRGSGSSSLRIVVVEQRLGDLLRRADEGGRVSGSCRASPIGVQSRLSWISPAGRSPPTVARRPPPASGASVTARDAATEDPRARLSQAFSSVGPRMGRSETLIGAPGRTRRPLRARRQSAPRTARSARPRACRRRCALPRRRWAVSEAPPK